MPLNKKFIFLILPLFYLIFSFIFLDRIQHFYINNFDAPYVYLLNGTNIASGHFRVGNIIHPGTPIEISTALVLFVKHLFTSNPILYQDVLLHPESYLFTCSIILSLLLTLVTYFIGIYTYRHSGNVLSALLFQASPLFCSVIVKMTICLNAESTITIIGIFFAAYLYINTIIRGKETSNRNAVVFGLFTALLFTTKIYCAPTVLLVLFMIKKWNQRILYLISFSMFSLILLFPLYNQLRNWAGSIKSMVFHSGAYGEGNSGVINSTLYKNNIIEIFTTHYLFTAVYIIVLTAFLVTLWNVFKRRVTSPDFISQITGIFIFFNLFILIIAKQYKVIYPEPLTHQVITITKYYYFIPLIIFFPLFISISYKILSPLVPFKFFTLYKKKLFGIMLSILIILGGQKTYAALFIDKGNQSVAVDKTLQFLNEWKGTPLIIGSDGNKACIEPALFIGISYSGRWDSPTYMDFIKKIYPNSYLYTTYNDELIFWDHQTDISTILRTKNKALVYLSGSDSTVNTTILRRICGEQNQEPRIDYKKIYCSANHYENIYLVKVDSLR